MLASLLLCYRGISEVSSPWLAKIREERAQSVSSRTGFREGQSYAVFYGSWDDDKVAKAQALDWVIAHPGPRLNNVSRETLRKIQAGADGLMKTDDDVKVLLYVSIGETQDVDFGPRDLSRTSSGPTYKDGENFVLAQKGFDPWLLDMRRRALDDEGQTLWSEDGYPLTEVGQDGLPDENGKWGSYFVRAGDEQWHQHLRSVMSRLRRLQPDGFFLDTVDTASPWGHYPWMQEEMKDLILNIRTWNPNLSIVMNRGMFLFSRWGKELSQAVDGLMFESYVSEWDWYRSQGVPHAWFASNRFTLEQDLLPYLKKGNFNVLFLNYFSASQQDAAAYQYLISRVVAETGGLSCVSSPDLQVWPWSVKSDFVRTVHPNALSALWTGRQWFIPIDERHKGRDLCLEVEPSWCLKSYPIIASRDVQRMEAGVLLPEMPPQARTVQLKIFSESGGIEESWQVDLWSSVPEALKKHPLNLGHIKAKATPMDGRLSFEFDLPEDHTWRLETQRDGDGEAQAYAGEQLEFLKDNLANGKSLWWRACLEKDGMGRGPWGPWQSSTPKDTTAPMPISHLSAQVKHGQLQVSWRSRDDSVHQFKVYVEQDEHGLSLPLVISGDQRSWSHPWPKGTKRCRLHLESVDAHQNGSVKVASSWVSVSLP